MKAILRPPLRFFELGVVEGTRMSWNDGLTRPVTLAELGQRYRQYRLADPDAEEAMAGSLRRWGQLSPVVACVRAGKFELIDGFKRYAAAGHPPGARACLPSSRRRRPRWATYLGDEPLAMALLDRVVDSER